MRKSYICIDCKKATTYHKEEYPCPYCGSKSMMNVTKKELNNYNQSYTKRR